MRQKMKKMPVILLIEVTLILFFGHLVPLPIKEILYALSLTIKSLLIFFLPIIVFGLLFKVAVSLAHSATKIIGVILIGLCLSNYISTFLSHYVGSFVYGFDLSLVSPQMSQDLIPTWTLILPSWIPNSTAVLLGLFSGIVLGFQAPNLAHKWAHKLEHLIRKFLGIFSRLIPIFVGGSVIRMQHVNLIETILKDYSLIVSIVILTQLCYIIFLYGLANRFNIRATILSIRAMLPAVITGFSSMSSAAALPLTMAGVEKSAKNPDLARSVVSASVNMHLLGDCIGIPIFAYALLKSFGMPEPSLMQYAYFTMMFCVAKFSAAGVPAGGIVVVLPILASHLGFNDTMTAMMFSIYVLFDPIMTLSNVFGNGAFALLMDRAIYFFRRKRNKIFVEAIS